MTPCLDLAGRRALVTGGGTGLGRQMALALAEAGAGVSICGRRLDPLESTAAELEQAGAGASFVQCDVTTDEGISRLRDELGQVDILVNNSGYSVRAPWTDVTPEDWREVMTVNVEAPFRLCQAFGPGMAERGFGRVINIASVYGVVAGDPARYPGLGIDIASYFASKHALVGLTKYLAVMLARDGVTVNAISPGMFPTEVNRSAMPDEIWRALEAGTPAGRLGSESDLKGAVIFLASDGSSFVTGHNLMVDGGWTLW
jgi:NAD(P)-dependent dehydrogenase (short-subunit alcohol dehydrogenase family)